MKNEKQVTMWHGECNGVPYEIKNWHMEGVGDCWSFYILFSEKQFPDLFDKIWLEPQKSNKFITYDYYNSPISSFEWHCGCTYYEKIGGLDGQPRAVQAGCDYQHLYDVRVSYTVEHIKNDVEICVKSILEKYDALFSCQYCGEYVKKLNHKNYCVKCKGK